MKQSVSLYLINAVILILITSCSSLTGEKRELRLWYDKPAAEWTEALPVGNGRIGAMVSGNTGTEIIQFNEESLWGGTNIPNNNPEALKHLPEIRRLILDDKIPEAFTLADRYLSGIPGKTWSYQTLGDLRIQFVDTTSAITHYRRTLNLETGVATTSFRRGGEKTQYRVFSSACDDVIIVEIRTTGSGRLNLSISLSRVQDAKTVADGNTLIMSGQVNDPVSSDRGPAGLHMKFCATLTPLEYDGIISTDSSSISFKNGKRIVLALTAATDYRADLLKSDPAVDPIAKCRNIADNVSGKPFNRILSDHINDHSAMFRRVSLDLGKNRKMERLPTDRRLEFFREGNADPGLLTTYFQYGRYLLMGSSRSPGVLPANLQGIWNRDINAPWNSDYHTNINLQMNYWPAEVCNLPETVYPLTDFVVNLTKPGSVTASEMYGAKGWVMHHTTDAFGKTAVLDGVYWGMFPMGGAWMTLPLWEHYLFTSDTAYLREKAYPVMKGAAEFICSFLTEADDGSLVTVPSYSPENSYIDPKSGNEFKLTYAPTMDNQIIREVIRNCRDAAGILDIDRGWADSLLLVAGRIPSDRVGSDSTIMEWIKDYKEADPGHRHISHLFALYPGTMINPATPALYAAARKTLEKRLENGGGHTGWSRAWIINFYARLGEGNEALKHLKLLLTRSTLTNLFDTHPPFQIDGNFGGTAGIAEMLLQSNNGEVVIMPALPDEWQKGEVRGLKARGNFEVSIKWKEGKVSLVKVFSGSGNSLNLVYGGQTITMNTEMGSVYLFKKNKGKTKAPFLLKRVKVYRQR